MLRTELDHIDAPLRGVEQQGERQPRRRPDTVPRFELRNLGLGPGVNAAAFAALVFRSRRWGRSRRAGFDRETDETVWKRLEPAVARERRQP